MSQKKSMHTKSYQEKRILNNILWFIENYLPQKKKRSSYAGHNLDKFVKSTIKKIKSFAFDHSKSLREDLSNASVTFTVGNWALPYLNFLKRIKLLK